MSISRSQTLRGRVASAPVRNRRSRRPAIAVRLIVGLGLATLGGCTSAHKTQGFVKPLLGSPVQTNNTPYTACLRALAQVPTTNRPVFAIGQITDKTGQRSYSKYNDSSELTQGVSEMVISAFFKTKQVTLTERLDVRVPVAEQQFVETQAIIAPTREMSVVPANFVVLGALTELNYNIVSGGARLFIAGIGGGVRKAVVNVGLDLRMVDVRTFKTHYVTSLQKQIVGYEVESGVYRFFGDHLIEFDAGAVKNEPLQLGVRSVVELATYQILTEGLGLPVANHEGCRPGESTHQAANPTEKNDEV